MNENEAQIYLEALIDYIVNTPDNFNANLFREYLINPGAINILIENYLKKIGVPITDDSAVPSDSSDPEPLKPSNPQQY